MPQGCCPIIRQQREWNEASKRVNAYACQQKKKINKINVVAQRYATTNNKNKPTRTTTGENGKLNSNIA
jgi:hypothetical protein